MALTWMLFGGPLVGEGFGELGDSSLGGCVGGDSDAALKRQERGDVDDFSWGIARDEGAAYELR